MLLHVTSSRLVAFALSNNIDPSLLNVLDVGNRIHLVRSSLIIPIRICIASKPDEGLASLLDANAQ